MGVGQSRKKGQSWLIPLVGIKKCQMFGSIQGAHKQALDPQGKQINLLPLPPPFFFPPFSTTTRIDILWFPITSEINLNFLGCYLEGLERFKTQKIRSRVFWSPDCYHETPSEISRGFDFTMAISKERVYTWGQFSGQGHDSDGLCYREIYKEEKNQIPAFISQKKKILFRDLEN